MRKTSSDTPSRIGIVSTSRRSKYLAMSPRHIDLSQHD
jgi:hypothetical protein